MSTQRRDFIGWVGASALLAAAPATLAAQPVGPRFPAPDDSDWDMSWTKRLKGKHKMVLDAPEAGGGEAVLRSNFITGQFTEVFGASPAETNRVLVLRHHGIHLAMNDAYWARFDIGESTGFKDASGRALKINPTRAARAEVPEPFRNLTLEAFQQSGGVVLACNVALQFYVVPKYAAAGMSAAAALAAAKADVLPGIILQPSGIFAVAVAQENGCSFVPAS